MAYNLSELKIVKDFGVRALISLIVILGYLGLIVLFVFKLDERLSEQILAMYTPIVMAVIIFYFRSTDVENRSN